MRQKNKSITYTAKLYYFYYFWFISLFYKSRNV